MIRHGTKKESETRVIARELAKKLSSKRPKSTALVVGFTGELGTGKTTFIKSFIRSMGVRKKITSPTFLIVRRFNIKHGGFENIYHVDAYRIKGGRELSAVGADEIFNSPKNIVLVEWADRVKDVLPKSTIWVKFKYGKERNEREITID